MSHGRTNLGPRNAVAEQCVVGAQNSLTWFCREERGVRVRVELGPRDAASEQCMQELRNSRNPLFGVRVRVQLGPRDAAAGQCMVGAQTH